MNNFNQGRLNVSQLVNKAAGKDLMLHKQYIHSFWTSRTKEENGLASRIMEMSGQEFWIKESDVNVASALEILAKTLSNKQDVLDEALISDAQLDNLLKILAYLSSAYAFRIIHWLDENRNTVANKLLLRALQKTEISNTEPDGSISAAGLMIERMIALNTIGLIQEIFNPTVTKTIKSLLRKFEENERRDMAI